MGNSRYNVYISYVNTISRDPRVEAVALALLQAEEAKASLSSAIRAAAADGLSCAKIAAAVGLTRNQVEYRGFSATWPSMRERPVKRKNRETIPPGMFRPAEAARILGISRTTVYARLRTGALTPFVTAEGRQMVHLGGLQGWQQD